MIFKGPDYHVKKTRSITVNTDKAVHLRHILKTDDNDSIVNSAITQFWRSFNYMVC